jgi:hypothetical protein
VRADRLGRVFEGGDQRLVVEPCFLGVGDQAAIAPAQCLLEAQSLLAV